MLIRENLIRDADSLVIEGVDSGEEKGLKRVQQAVSLFQSDLMKLSHISELGLSKEC